jgi:hypothetical protein
MTDFLQWSFGLFLLPLGWFWTRLNRLERRQDDLIKTLSGIKADTGYLRGRMEMLQEKQKKII